jgi:DNA primase
VTDFDLDRETIARVREAADAVEVVSEHVRLKRRGRTFEGLCPFHDEKTPSFSVDPEKGLYYCFGCHAGGDVFRFVMEIERLPFPEAVENLARRFGVQLPARSPELRRRRERSEAMRALLDEAQRWYVGSLASAAGANARRELERRGFGPETWTDYGFGWAPDDWRSLLDDLQRRHPEGALVEAGLAIRPETGSRAYDRFRSRITFPICSGDGKLIAFGGRILGDGEPKYLNSPEGPLFSKRSTLFCLDRARRSIGDRGEALVVEGYFDCLSLHRVGVTWAVATLGTALTAEHARLLRRRLGTEGRVVLCYDADAAGRRAAASGARVVLEAGLRVAVLVLPAGSDPDDVVREGGAEAMTALLEQPTSLVDFLVSDLPEDRIQRRRVAAEIAGIVGAAQDPHTRDELFFELSRQLGFSQDVLRDLARTGRRTGDATARSTGDQALPSGEAMLVRIVVEASPEWRRSVAQHVDPSLQTDPRVQRLLMILRDDLEAGAADDLLAHLNQREVDDELQLLVAEVMNRPAPELSDDAIRRQLTMLLREQARTESTRLNEAIRQAEDDGNLAALAELQRRKAALRTRQTQL